jgi:AraC-like DNA-binding protein
MNFYYEDRLHFQDPNIPFSIYENRNFRYLAHWHNDVELTIVKEGTIYVGVNNNRKMLVKGDMVLCCSGDIHYYEKTDTPSCVIILIFKPEIIGSLSNWPNGRKFESPFITHESLKESKLLNIYDILNNILRERREKDICYEMFVKAHIIELCALLLRNLNSFSMDEKSSRNYESNQKLMQSIMIYIEQNYVKNITLEGIASHFHIDPFNLSKKFNTLTGMNFKAYINALRVAKAQSMISNTSLPLMDIAFECGFNSIRNFNRVYKSLKGCTPSSNR